MNLPESAPIRANVENRLYFWNSQGSQWLILGQVPITVSVLYLSNSLLLYVNT